MTMHLKAAAVNFKLTGEFMEAVSYGLGHINSTYLVRCRQVDGTVQKYILQCINQQVFREPEKVITNILRVTQHLREKIITAGGDPLRETITLLPTHNGRFFHQTQDGKYWRMMLFIEGAAACQHAPSLDHTYAVGLAYGRFQQMLADFPVDQLHATIPDFHHTGKRLADFETAVVQDIAGRVQTVQTEIDFLFNRAAGVAILTDLQAAGELPLRITHNDTKCDNVLIDTQTGKGLCVIDLDTVMPGIALFDFADAVRSGTNSAAEDEPDLTKIYFDLAIFERLAHGFLDATRHFLTSLEIDYLVFASRLITYEQALRFLTDYLHGDIYYKIRHPQHNLDRCRTQIKLLSEMEAAADQMEAIITAYR